MKRKLITLIIALSFMTVLIPQQTFAAEKPLTKEVYLNVAENKPITGGGWSESYPITNLVDGMRTTFVVDGGNLTSNPDGKVSPTGKFWFTVDLQHRYNIEKIELWGRYDIDNEGGRRWFKIYAANNADFSDAVELAVMKDVDDEIFPPKGAFTVELDGSRAFRYVKMQRTGGYYHGYSEFKVFAKQTVTEVSRNKSVSAGITPDMGNYPPEKAVNGTNDSPTDAWYGGYYGMNWFCVDLEKELPIGYAEAENMLNQNSSATHARHNKAIYGAESFDEETGKIFSENAVVKNIPGVKRLSYVATEYEYSGWEYPFPESSASETKAYKASLDESSPYRYIVYHNETKSGYCIALGSFRAYVVNPKITAASANAKYITLEFSDPMNEETVNSENIRIKSRLSGEEVPVSAVNMIGEYLAEIELENEVFGDTLELEISDAVLDMRGVSMAAEKKSFEMPAAVSVEMLNIVDSASEGGSIITSIQGKSEVGARVTFKNNLTEESDISNAIILMLLCDSENTVVDAAEKRVRLSPESVEMHSVGLDLSKYESLEGYSLSVFVWNNFKDMTPWTERVLIN